jgi:hypothetical protein
MSQGTMRTNETCRLRFRGAGVCAVVSLLSLSSSACKGPDSAKEEAKKAQPATLDAFAPVAEPKPVAPARTDLPPLASKVVLTLQLELKEPGPVAVLSGDTNLPDDMKLVASVREPGDFASEGTREYRVDISRGRYRIELAPTGGLPVGDYEAVVLAPITGAGLPDSFTSVLGRDGERIQGDVVRRDENGIVTVEAHQRFFVGPSAEKAQAVGIAQRQRVKNQVAAAVKSLKAAVVTAARATKCVPITDKQAAVVWADMGKTNSFDMTIAGVVPLRLAGRAVRACLRCDDSYPNACAVAQQQLDHAASTIDKGKLD